MELTGKGYYLWQIKRAFDGDPAKIADAAKQAGLSHILIKVADGVYNYNVVDGVDLVPGLVSALRSRGISPWGWQYVYGVNASNEAKRAITRVNQLGLDGFVVNAEKEFKAPNMADVAKAYMQELRAGLPDLQIGLSTYRYPKLHAPFPFTAFLEFCDLNFPQIYWVGSSNPAQQLKRSIDEYKELTPVLPFIPTGAAYGEGSWSPTASQVIEFLQAAQAMELKAANFWEWQTAYVKTDLWSAIAHYDWAPAEPPAPPPPPPPPVEEPEPTPTPPVKPPTTPAPTPVRSPQAQLALEVGSRLIGALNSGSANQVVFLYESDGRLICNGQGRSGSRELYSWYVSLMRDEFKGAKFRLLDAGTQADFLKLVWGATLANGNTVRGTDLIRMDRTNKLIAVHHAAFSISKTTERALA